MTITCLSQDGALSVRWADEASIMYERATGGLLKNNLLMHFAHADFEEVHIHFVRDRVQCDIHNNMCVIYYLLAIAKFL